MEPVICFASCCRECPCYHNEVCNHPSLLTVVNHSEIEGMIQAMPPRCSEDWVMFGWIGAIGFSWIAFVIGLTIGKAITGAWL